MITLLRADRVAPVTSPAVADGAVVIDGSRVLDVGAAAEMSRRYPAARHIDFGRAAIVPGLVNAHTHLELTAVGRAPCPAGGLPDWIIDLRRRREGSFRTVPPGEAVRMAVAQCLRFGVTTVGDVSYCCAETRAALASSPLRAVSFGEILALGPARATTDSLLRSSLDDRHAGPRLTIGLAPHAPYTVAPDIYKLCLCLAADRGMPLTTHLAETRFEREFLAAHAGPLRRMWDSISAFDGTGLVPFADGPVHYARTLGLLDHPALLAHVNHCDDGELDALARGRTSVVFCPRTHAYFGHPPHRWREMLARGVNVAVGTDSCASAPDLNVLDDLRLLHGQAPDVPAPLLWELATVRAARAMGLHRVGDISPGAAADLAVFPCAGPDPLLALLEEACLPLGVWIDGAPVR